MQQDTQQIKVKVPQEEIVFIDMVFKSYEGLASLTISSDRENIVLLDVTEGTREDVLTILDNFKEQFPVEIVEK